MTKLPKKSPASHSDVTSGCFTLILFLIVSALSGCAKYQGQFSDTSLKPPLIAPEEKPAQIKLETLSKAPFFSHYDNNTGLRFKSESEIWKELPNKRTYQGLPVKTLYLKDNPKVSLRLFNIQFSTPLPDSASLETALGYLFKIRPATGVSLNGPFKKRDYESTLPSSQHCASIFTSSQNIMILYLDGGINNSDHCKLPGIISEVVEDTQPTTVSYPDSACQSAIQSALGLILFQDSSYSKAMEYFQTAYQLDQHYAPNLLNICAVYQINNEETSAIQFLNTRLDFVEKNSALAGILGSLYEAKFQYQKAELWSRKALILDPDNVEWLINLSDALWQLGERVQSKIVLLDKYARDPGFRITVYLANTYLGLEEYSNAWDILEQIHSRHTPSTKSMEYAMRSLNGLKHFSQSLVFFQNMSSPDSINAKILVQKSLAEFNLKLYRQAHKTIKQALELETSNDEANELEAQISSVLGKRTNFMLRKPITPLKSYKASKWLQRGPELSGSSTVKFALLEKEVLFKWEPNKKWHKTIHMLFDHKGGQGAPEHRELTFELNAAYSRFYVNQYYIYNTRGRLIDSLSLNDYYITRNHNSTLHPENLLIHLPVPSRKDSTYLRITLSEESRQPVNEFPFIKYISRSIYPILHNNFEVIAPPAGLNIFTFGNVSVDTSSSAFVFNLPPDTFAFTERFSPSYDEYGSGFSLAPLKTWQKVGEEYHKYLHRTGIIIDSVPFATRELAQEILDRTRPGTSPIKAMYQFVRDSIKYDNYEFSLHALIPEKSNDVIVKGYTDCKGHALLLSHLLAVCGIKSNLCLVNLEHHGYPSQPSLHQFNHMIVHVPGNAGDSGSLFLDPTEKFQAFRKAPLALIGKNALIIDYSAPRLETIPEDESSLENGASIHHFLKSQGDTVWAGKDSIIFKGKFASDFRSQLKKWKSIGKKETIISWISEGYSGYVNGALSIYNEAVIDTTLIIVFDYASRRPAPSHFQTLSLNPRVALSMLRYPRTGGRSTPIYFGHPLIINAQWQITLPEGSKWEISAVNDTEQSLGLAWQININKENKQTLAVSHKWELSPILIQPDDFLKLKAEWDNITKKAAITAHIVKD